MSQKILRRRAGFYRFFTDFKFSRAVKCLLPVLFLWMAVGCADETHKGVLGRLPSPAMRSGVAAPRVVQTPPAVIVAPPVEEPAPPPVPQPQYVPGGRTVVIDPGHGGEDSGTLGCSSAALPEKRVNLSIALNVANDLRSRGINVVMTRSDDHFIPLDERPAIANRIRADLFVSIHVDASTNHGATGSTVFISRSPGSRSMQAAECVRDALSSGGIKCNGVKHAGYRVLVKNDRPCMLVECGFLSNSWEARNLCDPGYQSRVAACIAQGIANSLGR